jgi:hypothetical protein
MKTRKKRRSVTDQGKEHRIVDNEEERNSKQESYIKRRRGKRKERKFWKESEIRTQH